MIEYFKFWLAQVGVEIALALLIGAGVFLFAWIKIKRMERSGIKFYKEPRA